MASLNGDECPPSGTFFLKLQAQEPPKHLHYLRGCFHQDHFILSTFRVDYVNNKFLTAGTLPRQYDYGLISLSAAMYSSSNEVDQRIGRWKKIVTFDPRTTIVLHQESCIGFSDDGTDNKWVSTIVVHLDKAFANPPPEIDIGPITVATATLNENENVSSTFVPSNFPITRNHIKHAIIYRQEDEAQTQRKEENDNSWETVSHSSDQPVGTVESPDDDDGVLLFYPSGPYASPVYPCPRLSEVEKLARHTAFEELREKYAYLVQQLGNVRDSWMGTACPKTPAKPFRSRNSNRIPVSKRSADAVEEKPQKKPRRASLS
ncbi:uncharacterized protein B0I36DRAFT_368948 [Microdochium trichocladiopsis]|uniref:Uncharacterized protein n=1 Tax=Microdochium trichocladiopsis TaxID=1682393 RepID=A0A9P8XTD7_9PEZI|nr:uncharacterized protein B0I36DRAFT_368948 [Microdochium trichocladiopsis]KAH7016412.1 hypothetical protein B0I36DRAFT_368948 [Microdochium trichocladiopsis]